MSEKRIFERFTVAEVLDQAIQDSAKTQKEIATEIGYDKPNIITMFKQGSTRLPLPKIGPMARALNLDPVSLLKLALLEYAPETWEAIEDVLGTPLVLTENETKLIRRLRALTDESDPPLSVAIDDKVSVVIGLPGPLFKKLLKT
jgi:hypothetical protein